MIAQAAKAFAQLAQVSAPMRTELAERYQASRAKLVIHGKEVREAA
jgi:hypothetical protein